MCSVEVRPLTASELADVTRLHKFSSQSGSSVFGSRDLTTVLNAAALQEEGAFGFIALMIDPEEPEEPEVVGALTAQHSTDGSSGMAQPAAATVAAAAGDAPATCPEVVLLTLVVRADARRQGMGAALLHALLQHTVQQQQQQQPAEQRVCRVVADVSLANAQAWSFFKKAGFQQGPTAGATAEAVLQLDALQPDMTEPPGGAVGMARGVAAAVMQANRHSGWLAAPVPPPCGQGGLGGRAVHSRHQPQPVVCRQGQQAVRCRERTLRPVTRSLMHMRVSTAAACSAVHYM